MEHHERHEVDTGKEVMAYPMEFIEHDPHGSPQTVLHRNSAHLPEALPPADLEVATKNGPQSRTSSFLPEPVPPSDLEVLIKQKDGAMTSTKPLPPPPPPHAPSYEAAVVADGVPPKKRKLSWKVIIIIAVVAVVILIAVIVGVVVGTRKGSSSSDDGQSDLSNAGETSLSSSILSSTSSSIASSSTSTSAAAEPSSSGPSIQIPDEDDIKIGSSFSASFTYYGSADGGDGVNCKTSENSCGLRAESGYAVGVSQNLYAQGMTCGTCWRLHADVDAGQKVVNRTIVVLVNEICPAEGFPICGMKNLSSVNEYDAQTNFNLCVDTGAVTGLFGRNSGVDMAIGNATRVDCKEWQGKIKKLW
jgi:hypothetical protein